MFDDLFDSSSAEEDENGVDNNDVDTLTQQRPGTLERRWAGASEIRIMALRRHHITIRLTKARQSDGDEQRRATPRRVLSRVFNMATYREVDVYVSHYDTVMKYRDWVALVFDNDFVSPWAPQVMRAGDVKMGHEWYERDVAKFYQYLQDDYAKYCDREKK
jgi:hypothetical protein